MELRPVDLPELVAVVMGTSIVLIPVLAFAARFAFKPLAEALGRLWLARDGSPERADRLAFLEKRLAMLERRLETANDLAGLSAGLALTRRSAPVD